MTSRPSLALAAAWFTMGATLSQGAPQPLLHWDMDSLASAAPPNDIVDDRGSSGLDGLVDSWAGPVRLTTGGPIAASPAYYAHPGPGTSQGIQTTGGETSLDVTNSYAISAWFQGHDAAANSIIAGRWADGNGEGFVLRYPSDDTVVFQHRSGPSFNTITSAAIVDTDWHLAVGVFKEGVGSTLWLDGAKVNATPVATTTNGFVFPPLVPDFRVGAQDALSVRPFAAGIDDVRVYDVALGDDDILALFAGGTPAPESSLNITSVVVEDVSGLRFEGDAGLTYELECTLPPQSDSWASTGARLRSDGGPAVMFDPAGFSTSKLYRVVVADPHHAAALFRYQYGLADPTFCSSEVCADLDNDGTREIVLGSHGRILRLLNAADGTVRWSKSTPNAGESTSAYDLDADGRFEILYTMAYPQGALQVIDHTGTILRSFVSGDIKLGNSPVILDGDGDRRLDAYLGSRHLYLYRLWADTMTVAAQRDHWSQCGAHTSAMDVDGDGIWDLFAGSGDDNVNPPKKGVMYRLDPVTLQTVWSYHTDDNASSADAVLADIDGDGRVEILKSVDNYHKDDAHDTLYAFTTDGQLVWKVPGIREEDSPNAADLDGDGTVEIVGMTFGSEVYCLDATGQFKWRKDLRPEHGDVAWAYMTPVLCDVDGDAELEILAVTNGGWDDPSPAVLFALSANGAVLDQFSVANVTYAGSVYICNVDDDPFMEVVVSGRGGMDVIETKGYGPNTEHFTRRRSYQRNNVVPWAYDDEYFNYRGTKDDVVNRTDDLVLVKEGGAYKPLGSWTSELLRLPGETFVFERIQFEADQPEGTRVQLNIADEDGNPIVSDVSSGQRLDLQQPLRLEFVLETVHADKTPRLDSYSLAFHKR